MAGRRKREMRPAQGLSVTRDDHRMARTIGAVAQPWLSSLSELRNQPASWRRNVVSRTAARFMKIFYALPSVPLSTFTCDSVESQGMIRDGACMPPFCGGRHDDLSALMQIAFTRQPSVIVEFGTAYGNTVANLCRICPKSRIFTVNALPAQITGNSITYALSQEEIGSVYRRSGFSNRVVQIYCDTLKVELAPYLSGAAIDLAIIDACHDAEYVVNDFLKIIGFMAPNGMVLLHDTHPSLRSHLWSSYVGCMQLRRRGYRVNHIQGTWWAVWTRALDSTLSPRETKAQ